MGYLCLSVSSRRSGLASVEKIPASIANGIVKEVVSAFPGSEGVPLRTCNRVEVYFHTPDAQHQDLKSHIQSLRLAPRQNLTEQGKVVEHLFMVSSGLDSELIGEDEVLGQVRSAYLTAKEKGEVHRELSELFERAVHVGRRVRNESSIGGGHTSLSRLAIEEARRWCPSLESVRIGILGSGQMGEKILSGLISGGATDITVTSRGLQKRKALSETWPVHAKSPSALIKSLSDIDVLFCAAESEKPILTLKRESIKRRTRPIVIVDLGVPPNVHSESNLPSVHLTTMRSLQRLSRLLSRQKYVAARVAKAIVADEVQLFLKEREDRDVAQFAEKLFRRAERIANEEQLKTLRKLKGNGTDAIVLRNMTASMIKRLLLPTVTALKTVPPAKRSGAINFAERLLTDPPEVS